MATHRLLTCAQIIRRVRQLRTEWGGDWHPFAASAPIVLFGVPSQRFFVLRVDQADEAHYVRELGLYPIARMPEWGVVDFLINADVEMEKGE